MHDFTLPHNWRERQSAYWNAIAQEYDSLYQNWWSKAEDNETLAILKSVLPARPCDVLDLACGTGLGYEMCSAILKEVRYVGLDISSQMLTRFKERYPLIPAYLGRMSDLSNFSSESFDVVISLYTSFSYTERPVTTLKEIHRVLKPRGRFLISLLNRWSLRRMLSLKLRRIEEYRTRNSTLLLSTPTITYSRGEVFRCLSSLGFSELRGGGQGIFAGWFERDGLWKIDVLTSSRFPMICNTINFHGMKA